MAGPDEEGLAELKRDTRRRGVRVQAVTGVAMIALAALLLWLGLTFEEPEERLATSPVPVFAVLGLIAIGVVVGVGGLAMLREAVRDARGDDT